MAEESVKASTEMTQPVIIDLGRKRSKRIRELKRGEGKLWDEVFDVMEEVKDTLGQDAAGKVLVPVVMIYEKVALRRLDLEKVLFPLLDLDNEDDDDEDEEED